MPCLFVNQAQIEAETHNSAALAEQLAGKQDELKAKAKEIDTLSEVLNLTKQKKKVHFKLFLLLLTSI
jgi:hypothetical protein